MTLRARVTLVGTGVAAAVVVLFAIGAGVVARATARAQQDQVLAELVQQAAARVTPYAPAILRRATVATAVDAAAGSAEFVEVFDSTGASVYSTGVLGGTPVPLSVATLRLARDSARPLPVSTVTDGVTVRWSLLAVTHLGAAAGGWVVAGASTAAVQGAFDRLNGLIALMALAVLAGGAATMWWFTRRSLRPLQAAAATAEAIRADRDLSRRLPPAPHGDEVGHLVANVNGMLEELEHTHRTLDGALATQRRFVADASHELRTPLTSIRSNVTFLRDHPGAAPGDRAAALGDIDGESARMARLVDDLLMLARGDAGKHLTLTIIDLPALVAEVGRQAAGVLADRHLRVETVPLPRLAGNADALVQLCWILISNAQRHTRPGGVIAVELSRGPDDAVLEVVDDGPGIPSEQLRRIFERFHRVDAARQGGGAGLGLAIADWIVAEHGGSIEAVNRAPRGARFIVRLPFSADS